MIDQQHQNIHVQKRQQQKYQFDELLNCQICYCQAASPTMCPHCSKLYCQFCISKTIRIKPECPNCRKQIKGQLTNCTRFISELTSIVGALIDSGEQLQKCSEHEISLNYYCQDCSKSVCCECKMFGDHQSHSFKPISFIYQLKYDRIRNLLSELKSKITQKESLLMSIECDLSSIKVKTEAQLLQIDEFTERYRNQICNQNIKASCNEYENIQSLMNNIARLDEIKEQIVSKLEQAKKHHCYKYDLELIGQLEDLLKKNKDNCSVNRSIQALEEAIPSFQKYRMIIHQYSQKKLLSSPIYSETNHYQLSQWRLVVYPRGNLNDNQSLSIFLQLLKNPDNLNQYEYQIELINHQNQKKNLIKQHRSSFQTGQCWGYNRFIKTQDLENQGYVNQQTDQLQIVYGLKFSYYCDLYKRRQLILRGLQCELQRQNLTVEQLQTKIIQRSTISLQSI